MVDISPQEDHSRYNILDADPFWYSIYRPILLRQMEKICANQISIGSSLECQIGQRIVEGLALCKTWSRSEAHLFLMNVKFEFGDSDDIDRQKQYKFLMGILHDITGKQKVQDLRFFRDLRDTFYRCDSHHISDLDKYIFNKLFFIQVENVGAGRKDRNFSILHLCDTNAFYSSHAIQRFYHETKWSLMRSITMCSRLALCYRWDDPLNMMRTVKHYQPSHHMVTAEETSIAQQLAVQLRPFAGPLPDDLDYVYVRQSDFPDIRIDTLRHLEKKEGESNIVTTSEVPIGLTHRTISDEITKYSMNNIKQMFKLDSKPIGIEINTKSVSNQNIFIRVNEWLTWPSTPRDRRRDYNMRWIIPGLPISFSYRPMSFVQARFTKGSAEKIQFLPMGPILETDRCVGSNRRLENLTQNITRELLLVINGSSVSPR